MKYLKYILPAVFVAVVVIATNVYGAITLDSPTPVDRYRTYEFFASSTAPTTVATTTTATSTNITAFLDSSGRYDAGYFNIHGAKKVTLYFSRGGATSANTGSTLFRVQVTDDGSTWQDFSKLVQSTSTAMQPNATIAAATTTLMYGMNLDYDSFLGVRCIALETTDGEHRCRASAEF